MTKSIKSIEPAELAIGKTITVTFRGSGFNATYSKNRVVLKLKKTGTTSKNIITSETLRGEHSSRKLRVNISSNQLLRQEQSEIRRAEDRVFMPAIELLDDAKKVVETIDAPGDLVMKFTDQITSITPIKLKIGKNENVVFAGSGFSKSWDYNTPVLKLNKADAYPAPYITITQHQEETDTTSFRVDIYVDPRVDKTKKLVPTVEVDDGKGNVVTLYAADDYVLSIE